MRGIEVTLRVLEDIQPIHLHTLNTLWFQAWFSVLGIYVRAGAHVHTPVMYILTVCRVPKAEVAKVRRQTCSLSSGGLHSTWVRMVGHSSRQR